MSNKKLWLNPEIAEFILCGLKYQQNKLQSHAPINILDAPLIPTYSVRNLAIWFNTRCFHLVAMLGRVCVGCFIQMHDLRHIGKYLTREATVLACNALMGNPPDPPLHSSLPGICAITRYVSGFSFCLLLPSWL